MEKTTRIDTLALQDIPAYKALIDACFGASTPVERYITEYHPEDTAYTILIAKQNGKLVGSATLYRLKLFTFDFQPAIEVFNVAVLPEARGIGIGSALIGEIKDIAKEEGYRSIHLTCLSDAYDAHALYEKNGFHRTNSYKYAYYEVQE